MIGAHYASHGYMSINSGITSKWGFINTFTCESAREVTSELAHTQTHTLTHTELKTILEALFDLYVRSLFQNPIRLASPRRAEKQQGRRGRKWSWEHGVKEQQELNTHHICPRLAPALCSGAAGAQHAVFDVASHDWGRSLERGVEWGVKGCEHRRGWGVRSESISLPHATLWMRRTGVDDGMNECMKADGQLCDSGQVLSRGFCFWRGSVLPLRPTCSLVRLIRSVSGILSMLEDI